MDETEYYLKGLKDNDYKVLNEIYVSCSKPIFKHILKNNGTEEDAWDVFQDGLLVVMKKLKNDDFTLTSSFGTYLFAVCKYVWLQKLEKNSKKQVTNYEVSQLTNSSDIEYIQLRKERIFNNAVLKLSDECQSLLKLYFLKVPGKDIAKKMGYTVEYVKRKKYKCKQKLISIVKKDKDYTNFIKGD